MIRISKALVDSLWAFTRPRIAKLYYAGGGLGDELMFTAVAAEARRRGSPLHVLTDRPEVWEGNADPASVQTGIARWFRAKTRGRINTDIKHLTYVNRANAHLAQQMAEQAGIELPTDWTPVYRPRQEAAVETGCIVLQNSCRGALYAATTKEWPFNRWARLADRLMSEGHKLVQIGTQQDPLMSGAVDMRGKTSLPRVAAILEQAKLFIGLESGLMHLAAAMRIPSVIIYGGRTRPWETGYPWHWHAANTAIFCAGCALNSDCPNSMRCMTEISIEEVETLVKTALRGEKGAGDLLRR